VARRQLGLFLGGDTATRIEDMHRVAVPVQGAIIPAQVMVCCEDGFALNVESMDKRLSGWTPFALRFGSPEVFSGSFPFDPSKKEPDKSSRFT
jgi:hypothetical protein